MIVRDFAVDAVARYAATGDVAAERAYLLLREALTACEGKQAGHALKGLANVARRLPSLRDELLRIGEEYARSDRGVVRKAPKELLRSVKPTASG